MPFDQGTRLLTDGAVAFCRVSDPERRIRGEHWELQVTTHGQVFVTPLGHWNAFRVVGMMALALGIPLSKHVAKAIRLG